jgi:microsomal dipeptidase-like Zn-dependent dipeptidase
MWTIAETGGVVGLNFEISFLRSDGKKDANTPLSLMISHLDKLIERLGEDGVCPGIRLRWGSSSKKHRGFGGASEFN